VAAATATAAATTAAALNVAQVASWKLWLCMLAAGCWLSCHRLWHVRKSVNCKWPE